jgi:hypothetical protein
MVLIAWFLEHQLTLAALTLTALAAFAVGKYDQQFLDAKKATSHANVK